MVNEVKRDSARAVEFSTYRFHPHVRVALLGADEANNHNFKVSHDEVKAHLDKLSAALEHAPEHERRLIEAEIRAAREALGAMDAFIEKGPIGRLAQEVGVLGGEIGRSVTKDGFLYEFNGAMLALACLVVPAPFALGAMAVINPAYAAVATVLTGAGHVIGRVADAVRS